MNTKSALCSVILLAATASCALLHDDVSSTSSAVGKDPLSTPTITIVSSTKTTITVRVCAGATGASGGFSLHWLASSLLPVDGKWPDSSDAGVDFCHASFSGNAHESRFDLGAYDCEQLVVGALTEEAGASFSCTDPLVCGTEYAFRAFAHGGSEYKRSLWSSTVFGSTSACDDGCTYTQGYWKTHTPWATKPALKLDWPVLMLKLGTVWYPNSQIGVIFDTPVKGNGLVALAHQLAAAKLNLASGATGTSIASTIAAADALIGGNKVPAIGTDWLSPTSTSALTAALAAFNEGVTGPGHCGGEMETLDVAIPPSAP